MPATRPSASITGAPLIRLSTKILATSRTVMSGMTDMTLLVITSDARMASLLNGLIPDFPTRPDRRYTALARSAVACHIVGARRRDIRQAIWLRVYSGYARKRSCHLTWIILAAKPI